MLYKWGMYNFRYYQKESGLQWGVIFLILSIAINIWMLGTKMIDDEWMLIGSISLVMILITPLGSNNYVWPALNNLFFTAPVTFWMVYKFARWGREYVDSTGKFGCFVFEQGKEISLEKFVKKYKDAYIHLERVKSLEAFFPYEKK